jgi:predicted ferric reductase
MRKHQLGNAVIVLLVIVNVVLYLVFPPPNTGDPRYWNRMIGEIFSSSAMVLMSVGLVLANKPRLFEEAFGGLDKMYKSHKTAGLTALFFLAMHFFTIPLQADPYSPGRLLGKFALLGLATLVLLTLAPRIPVIGGYIRLAYHQWRYTHQFIGLFFIIGFVHMLQVDNISKGAPIPNLYWNIIVYIGMAAYINKEIISRFISRGGDYTVEAARKLNPSTLEVILKPKGKRSPQTAGQFMFVHFPGDKLLSEPHPFTISSGPKEGVLRLSIKSSGDWTKHLYEHLKPGMDARVDGCYGRLDYKQGGPKQIWIAGGIGVTPFLSWMRDFEAEPPAEIDFFYTVRADADALFADEFTAAAAGRKNFRSTIVVSSRDGSLTMDKMAGSINGNVADRHVYMCGPVPMIEAFKKQFLEKGVPQEHIHFEEFNFR